MESITINSATCKKCSLCVEVCPNKIFFKDEEKNIRIHPEYTELCFQCGQCMAVCETQSVLVNGLSYEKDFFDLSTNHENEMEKSFLDLIQSRRAIRNFKGKAVPKELLMKIADAISYAPPGFPPLKTRLIIIQNTEKISQALPFMIRVYEKLVVMMKNPIIRFFIKKEVGKKKFKTMQEHLIPLLYSRLPGLISGTEDTLMRNAPAMILFLDDIKGEDISQDISIAATYGMLASHSMGLGGSIMDIIPPAINKDKELRRMFGIKDTEEVYTSLIIGYPKYKYQRGIKRNLKEIQWV